MLHKYEHKKGHRTRAWRRYQQERVVKNRLTNDERYIISSWGTISVDDGDIRYGDGTWVDLLGKCESKKARTSFSFRKSWGWKKKYSRIKNERFTQRLLWEEGIIERIGCR